MKNQGDEHGSNGLHGFFQSQVTGKVGASYSGIEDKPDEAGTERA